MSGPPRIPDNIKIKVLENLRSGKYTQHNEWFINSKRPNCYSVLGVFGKTLEEVGTACEVDFRDGSVLNSPFSYEWGSTDIYLTELESLIEWREKGIYYRIDKLSVLNDDGLTFSQLADVIEYFY